MATDKRFSLADARVNIETILDLTDGGQVVELTRGGRPVAAVVSLVELAPLRGQVTSFSDAYARFIESHPLEDVGLDESWFDELRRSLSGAQHPAVSLRYLLDTSTVSSATSRRSLPPMGSSW